VKKTIVNPQRKSIIKNNFFFLFLFFFRFSILEKHFGDRIPDVEGDDRAERLEGEEHDAQRPLRHWAEQDERLVDEVEMGRHPVEQPRALVEHGEPVPRARNDLEQLRQREHKVENLRREEQEQRLGKVAQDPGHRKHHPGVVAEEMEKIGGKKKKKKKKKKLSEKKK
jgi:hypothetical protein